MGVGAQSVTGLCGCGGSECDGFMWVYVGVGAQSVTGLCGFMWVWGLRV